MARGRGLYHQITEPDNLRLAFKKALKGKSDRREVIDFRCSLDDNLVRMRTELLTGDIHTGPYRFFTVRDPKERTICAAPFRDRVLHHAVMNICEPELERYAVDDSYACRPGKGLHRALKRAQHYSRKSSWYLKLDIRKYFDSIHHDTLLQLLSRRIYDKRLMELFTRMTRSYETLPGRGIPIGNLLSQHFANFYLGILDHWLLEERKAEGYIRYMDDFIIFAQDRETLKSELAAIEAFLAERLRLTLKDNRQLNRCSAGIPFLGFRIFPHTTLLAPRSRRRFSSKLEQYELEYEENRLPERELARRVSSLVSFTSAADAAGFRRSVIIRQGVPSGRAPTA